MSEEMFEVDESVVDYICELDSTIKEQGKKLDSLKSKVKSASEMSGVREFHGTDGNKLTVTPYTMSEIPVKDYVKTCQSLEIPQERWLPTLKVLVAKAKTLIGTASAEGITEYTLTNNFGKLLIKKGGKK